MAEMSPTRKRIAMLIVVVGSALIGERVVTLMSGDSEVVEPATGKRATPRAKAGSGESGAADGRSAATVQLERLEARQRSLVDRDASRAGNSTAGDLFEPVAWQSVAPAFPYAYLGGLLEDGVRTTFFTQGDRVLPVKAGDTVDAVYRVDQMTEKQMTLTYLPLNQSLTLALGNAR